MRVGSKLVDQASAVNTIKDPTLVVVPLRMKKNGYKYIFKKKLVKWKYELEKNWKLQISFTNLDKIVSERLNVNSKIKWFIKSDKKEKYSEKIEIV